MGQHHKGTKLQTLPTTYMKSKPVQCGVENSYDDDNMWPNKTCVNN